MLYEIYQSKIQKTARVLSKIVRMLPIIIPTVAVIVAAIITVLALKGTVLDLQCPAELEYGQQIECQSKMFWSDVWYEYSTDGGTTWVEEAPIRAGTYLVRASGKTLFGGYRECKPVSVVIHPKKISVSVVEPSVMYGNAPTATTDIALLYQDRLVYEDFVFSNGAANTTADPGIAMLYDVKANLENIKILDGQGNDVTDSYEIEVIESEIAILKRPITVTVEDASQIYNDLPFLYKAYELTQGTLYEKDLLVATFTAELTDPGSVPNEPALKVITQDGADRTVYYDISSVYGTLTVEKRPIVITPESGEFVYNGQVYNCSDYILDESTPLASGHQLVLLSNAKPIDVGEYPNTQVFEVHDENGANKTANYAIFLEEALIKITPRPLMIHTESSEWVYDGQDHMLDNYVVEGLVETHDCDLSVESIRNVGAKDNRVVVNAITDENGESVIGNYAITYVYGTLTVTPRPLTVTTFDGEWVYDAEDHMLDNYIVDGLVDKHDCVLSVESIRNAGSKENSVVVQYITDENGESVTGNYAITYVYGKLTVTPRPLTVTTFDGEWVYDGEDHMLDNYVVDGLLDKHDCTLSVESIRNVGTKENSVIVQDITDENGGSVIENYAITNTFGTLTVTHRPLAVTTFDGEWVYDGQDHMLDNFTVVGLVPKHQFDLEVASIRNVGTIENSVVVTDIWDENQERVIENYAISYEFGTLTVTPRPLHVFTGDGYWIYDGQYHESDGYTFDGLVEWHTVVRVDPPQIKNAGIIENIYSILVYSDNEPVEDPKGEPTLTDVTYNYDITYEYGTLEVARRPVMISTMSGEWIYDAQEHYVHEYVIVSELGIAEGEELVVWDWSSLIDAGSVQNKFAYVIRQSVCTHGNASDPETDEIQTALDEDLSTDLTCCETTFNYEITWDYGMLVVHPRPIIFKPVDEEKVYDDVPLNATKLEITEDSPFELVQGHTLEAISVLGSIIDVGSIESIVESYRVLDENANDVTHNYLPVAIYNGKLTVLPRQITIYTANAEKYYDGSPLIGSEFGVYPDQLYDLVAGHIPYVVFTGTQTEIGESENSLDITKTRILSSTREVTHNYDIQYVFGKLEVLPSAIIHITSATDWKYYDGEPLVNPNYEVVISKGALRTDLGHQLIVEVFGSITEIGSAPNYMTVRIVDADMQDVSGYYVLTQKEGWLEIREQPKQDEEEPEKLLVGQIKTDKGGILYLKQRSYGNYNGTGWDYANPYGYTLPGGLSYEYLTAIALAASGQQLSVAEFKNMVFYMLPYYMTAGGDYEIQSGDTVYKGSMNNYTVPYYAMPSISEGFARFQGNLGELSGYEEQYREYVYDTYLTIDTFTLAYMQRVIAEQGFDVNDADIIESVAQYIKNAAVYDSEYDKMMDKEPNVVLAFLSIYKRGICTHYASAATLLYRALGIPARYVEGYMVETEAGKFVEITSPGHAWVEVYIDGIGWIQVEVTGSEESGGSEGGGSEGGGSEGGSSEGGGSEGGGSEGGGSEGGGSEGGGS